MVNICHLNFSYKSHPVFSDLSLEFKPGHIYGLLGRNGSGKSTLLRSIAGLLFPQKGDIRVLGQKPALRKPSFLRQVFLVPEEFQLPNSGIKQFVKNQSAFYPGFDHAHFSRHLREFELDSSQNLRELSYGQKKKVLISFCLACNTPLILLDEPSNGLDIVSKSQFRKVIAGAINENKCIVISTHQVKDLENLIDRVCILDDGKILFDETTDRIAEKLSFRFSSSQNDLEESLYAEPTLRGHALVMPNKQSLEGRIDLELLYKAIAYNRDAIHKLFNS